MRVYCTGFVLRIFKPEELDANTSCSLHGNMAAEKPRLGQKTSRCRGAILRPRTQIRPFIFDSLRRHLTGAPQSVYTWAADLSLLGRTVDCVQCELCENGCGARIRPVFVEGIYYWYLLLASQTEIHSNESLKFVMNQFQASSNDIGGILWMDFTRCSAEYRYQKCVRRLRLFRIWCENFKNFHLHNNYSNRVTTDG